MSVLSDCRMRSRNMEAGIPLDYLQSLYDAYEEFIKEISHVIPVIRVSILGPSSFPHLTWSVTAGKLE